MRTLMNRKRAPRATPHVELFDDVSEVLDEDLAARDPLALEPLSAAEIALLEGDANRSSADDMDEQSEGAFEALRKASEAKLPIDPDAADASVEANDAHLSIHTRPERRR